MSVLVEVGAVKAFRNTYSSAFQLAGRTSNENLVLLSPLRGGLQVSSGAMHDAAPGQFLSLLSHQVGFFDVAPNTRTDNLTVPLSALDERLAKLLDRGPREPLQFAPVADLADIGSAAVQSVLHGLLNTVESQAPRSTEAINAMSTAILDLMLLALPHSYTEALHRDPVSIAPRQVRRAIAYIHDQPMPVLTSDELADICGVSLRSLQYAFREFVGMAPAEYWRKIRVERALAQLAQSPSESLSNVAAAWGFTNVTRFRVLAGLP